MGRSATGVGDIYYLILIWLMEKPSQFGRKYLLCVANKITSQMYKISKFQTSGPANNNFKIDYEWKESKEICMYGCIYVCMYVCMYMFVYVYVCVCVCVCVCVYIYIYIYI